MNWKNLWDKMKPVLRNLAAVSVGWIAGAALNMGIITLGSWLIPVPDGVDPTNVEHLKQNMHLFGPDDFIMPFLAHALGTLLGAYLAAKISVHGSIFFGVMMGGLFLIGGATLATMLPSPVWFDIIDLSLAYLPMGYLGGWLATKKVIKKN